MTGKPAFGRYSQGGPRRRSPVVQVVLVAAVALLVGGAGGVLAVRATGPSTPATSTPAPGLPDASAAFPSQDQQHLPDVTLTQVTQMQVAQGAAWDCKPTDSGGVYTDSEQGMFCFGNEIPRYRYEMTIEHDDDTHVRRVKATCKLPEGPGPGSNDPICRSIFTEVGGVAFAGKPELQQQARDWALENIDSDSSTTIEAVRIQVSLEPVSILLTPAF